MEDDKNRKELPILMVSAYLSTLRLFNRDVRLLLITAALTGFTFLGIHIVLFNLYLLRLGYGPEFIGTVNGVSQLGFALFSLPAGIIGRLWGHRRMLIAGLSTAAVGLGLIPLGELIPTRWQGLWLSVAYLIAWLGAGAYFVNGWPFLMNATSERERNHVFSVRESIFPLTGFAGTLVGGVIPGLLASTLGYSSVDPSPYRYSLLIAAVLFIPSVLIMASTREVDSKPPKEPLAQAGPLPLGLITFVVFFLVIRMASWGVANTFFNVYLDVDLGISTARIGTLSALSQILSVPAVLAMPILAVRWNKSRLIVLGTLAVALSMMPLGLIPHWSAAGLGIAGVTAFSAITFPLVQLFLMERVSPGWRGTISGSIMMAIGLSRSATSLGGGYLITSLGFSSLFLIAAGFTATSVIIFWVYLRAMGRELA